MLGFIDLLNRWGAAWTTLAGVALWQGLLAAALVSAAAFALRKASPATRYWLWQLVAIKLLFVPLGSWSIGLPWLAAESGEVAAGSVTSQRRAEMRAKEPAIARSPIATRDGAAQAIPQRLPAPRVEQVTTQSALTHQDVATALRNPPPPPVKRIQLTWQAWLLVAWASIVAFQFFRLLVQRRRLSRLLRATTAGSDELARMVAQVAEGLQLRQLPRVRLTNLKCSPFVCGIVRPLVVLPRDLPQSLHANELQQVLTHELAHLKRRDLLWGWITEIARILYFFHPAMLWAAQRVRLERELACDLLAMRHGGRSAAKYAETLVRVLSAASLPNEFRTATASLDGGHSLSRSKEAT